MKKLFFISFALYCAAIFGQSSQTDNSIIISEVMFAAKSGNNEFIEVYNTSTTNSVDLNNFQIKYYKSSADNFSTAGLGTILKPKSFAVIFEGDYDIQNGIYKDLVPSDALILKNSDNAFGSSGMSNSSDRTIQLFNSSGIKLEEYTYSANNSKGISDEKIMLNSDTTASNWKNSLRDLGTPGFRNSVSPINFDPGISDFTSEKKYGITGNEITLFITVKNFGVKDSEPFQLDLFRDRNVDSTGQTSELLQTFMGPSLPPGDSIDYQISTSDFLEGGNLFIAELQTTEDENLLNNISLLEITGVKINELRNDLVINEIMYAPNSPAPEWIEIFNRSEKAIDISGYNIADKSDTIKIINNSQILSPNEYFVFSSDSTITEFFNLPSAYSAGKLPILNNSGDKIILLDSLYRVIDSLEYSPGWGGNSGESLERIDPEKGSNEPENWNSSHDFLKATPGKINSVTQKGYDISADKILFSPSNPVIGDNVSISVLLKNNGKNPISFSVGLFEDTNADSLSNKKLDEINSQSLAKGDSVILKFNYRVNAIKETHSFIVEISSTSDEDSTNNRTYKTLTPGYSQNSLVINEIMYDPGKNGPEWLELFNNSDVNINLKNWVIVNLIPSTHEYLLSATDNFLAPNNYLVIAADSSFFEKHKELESNSIILNFGSLNNNFDGIAIRDLNNNLIDSVVYSSDWGGSNGISLERISTLNNSNNRSNWATSKNITGSTPGRINSVSQKDFDVSVGKIIFSPDPPLSGDNVNISALIKNPGRNIADFSLSLYEDTNRDSVADKLLDNIFHNNLSPEDSVLLQFNYVLNAISEKHNFIVKAIWNSDQDTSNNIAYNGISPGYRKNSVVINEIMYDPSKDEPEWFEIYNNSGKNINLNKWAIINLLPSRSGNSLTLKNYQISPGAFVVVAPDSSFILSHPEIKDKVINSNFGSLNNSTDGLTLLDSKGNKIDSVIYSSTWGGGNGFSLERISYSSESTDSTNWRASVDSGKSTPGFTNSATDLKSYKRNSLVINEIMFDPAANNSEFIEFFNTTDSTLNIGGWSFVNENDKRFFLSRILRNVKAGKYFVIAADSNFRKNIYNTDPESINIVKISSFGLANKNGLILLKDELGNTIDSVNYYEQWHNPNFTITQNISLEKINPFLEGNDKNNWSSSASIQGATPGKRNSIYTTQSKNISSKISISPNPFSPDNDGYEDFTIIKYKLPQKTAQVKIKIFDSKGRLVRTLRNNSATGTDGSVIFDGLDDNNNTLRMGIYIVLIEALNSNSGVSEKMKTVVVVAKKF